MQMCICFLVRICLLIYSSMSGNEQVLRICDVLPLDDVENFCECCLLESNSDGGVNDHVQISRSQILNPKD